MKNKYEVNGDFVVVYAKGYGLVREVLVDVSCLRKLLELNRSWYLHIQNTKANRLDKENAKYYVVCKYNNTRLFLHRFILDMHEDDGDVVDHINGNPLDNRLSNLRIVSQAKNSVNRSKNNANNKSGFRGVHWVTRDKRWVVYFRRSGKTLWVGRYKTLECAVEARNSALVNNEKLHEYINYS